MYKTKFEAEGMEVLTANDGEEGLRMALEKKPSAILLDVMMPKMSGVDLLSQLKKAPEAKNIPVIVLSNLSQKEEVDKAIALGAKEYLTKANITPAQIAQKIKSYIK
jgi:CheY-like chemotaxis protein